MNVPFFSIIFFVSSIFSDIVDDICLERGAIDVQRMDKKKKGRNNSAENKLRNKNNSVQTSLNNNPPNAVAFMPAIW
jgi:hypothetical protein